MMMEDLKKEILCKGLSRRVSRIPGALHTATVQSPRGESLKGHESFFLCSMRVLQQKSNFEILSQQSGDILASQ